MRRRRGAVLLAVALLSLTLAAAGCVRGSGSDPRTLRVWVLEASADSIRTGYRDLAADFERRHPGVSVQLTEIPYQQYQDKLTLAVQGRTGPDVMALDQIVSPEFAAAGLIENLDRFAASAPGLRSSDYFRGAWESNRWRGHLWGLPLNADVWERMFYNADLFRAVGLDPDRPPRTWAGWVAAARRLDEHPGASGIGLIGCRDEATSVLSDSLLYSAGGSIVRDNRVAFNSPQNRRAYRLYQRLAALAPSGVAGACDQDTVAQFTAGTTGMLLAGGWQQATIEDSARFEWRVAEPPAPRGGRFVGALGGYNLAVGSGAPDKRLAFDFVRLATGSVRHQRAVNDSVPALRAAGEPYVRESRRAPEQMLRMLEQGRPRPVTPVYSRISRAQQDAIQSIVDGTPVPEALRTASDTMRRALARP